MLRALCTRAEEKTNKPNKSSSDHANPKPKQHKALGKALLEEGLLLLLGALAHSWWCFSSPRRSSSTRGNVVGWFSVLLFFLNRL